MKAYALAAPGGLDRLRLVERADPGEPGPGEIRVAMRGLSINPHDLGVILGRIPAKDGRVPLADGCGVVEAVGPGVADFRPGDLAVSCFFADWATGRPPVGDFSQTPGDGMDGIAQDIVVRPAAAFTRAPQGYDAVEAASITTAGVTAWRALVREGQVKAGDTVLLLGTGGVSIWALQIARMFGARVAITSSSDAKLERARALGAEFCLNYTQYPNWGEKAFEWTGGEGFDHVLDVGGPATLAQSIAAVRLGGRIAMIGVLTGFSGEVPTAALMFRQARLQGLIVGSREDQRDFVRALDAGALRPVIDRRFERDGLVDACRYAASGAHFGKIGIDWR